MRSRSASAPSNLVSLRPSESFTTAADSCSRWGMKSAASTTRCSRWKKAALRASTLFRTTLRKESPTTGAAGPAAPVVGLSLRNVVLKSVDARKAAFFQRLHLVVDAALFIPQRLQLSAAVVNDSDGRSETKFDGALADRERILRMRNAAAHHRVDVHVKVGVLGQQLQLFVEDFQALLRDFIRIH